MYRKPRVETLTIPSGGQTSTLGGQSAGAIKLGSYFIASLYMPAAFTGATIGFVASSTKAGSYNTVYHSDGTPVTITVGTNRMVVVTGADADALAGLDWFKLVSASAEGGDRAIDVTLK